MDSSTVSAFNILSSSFIRGICAVGGPTQRKAPNKSRPSAVRKQTLLVKTCHLSVKVYIAPGNTSRSIKLTISSKVNNVDVFLQRHIIKYVQYVERGVNRAIHC